MNTKPSADSYSLQKIFKEETEQYEWSSLFDFSRLTATDAVITERPDGDDSFSTTLWNYCFPPIASTSRWHYTKLSTLRSIAQTRSIRLHAVEKRMGEGELTSFAGQFGLLGYLTPKSDGRRVIDNLARDLFYLSLASGDEPGPLWSFGEVRLRLLIEPVLQRAEIRQIRYSEIELSHPFRVFKKIASDRFDRFFTPKGVSRIGAFALPFYLDEEAEVRLLVKKFGDEDTTEVNISGQDRYICVPLNKEHDRVKIKLLEVQCSDPTANSEVAQIVASMADLGVQLTEFTEHQR
ncbi:hypothetical protein [Pseudomonas sp. Seg1]|uniref:hypothetical protein n=1 Tax=Pseudomonas sp. Seg1 TaxID=2678259 RepID=UPI001BB3DC88|nr:hypothetical protein [Pseudomonas sp. Seg1]